MRVIMVIPEPLKQLCLPSNKDVKPLRKETELYTYLVIGMLIVMIKIFSYL